MGRYSLIAEDRQTHQKRLIRCKELSSDGVNTEYKDKVDLSTIDKYTLKFNNQEELADFLKQHGIITSKDVDLFIEYKSSGTKTLQVVYSDYVELAYFVNCSKDLETNSRFRETINNFLNKVVYKSYFSFMIRNNLINKHIQDQIVSYLDKVENKCTYYETSFLRTVIIRSLAKYKNLRGIIIGNHKYETEFGIDEDKIYETDEYSNIIAAFENGGYDELYSLYDREELESLPKDIQKN